LDFLYIHHAMAGGPASRNFIYIHRAMAGRPASHIFLYFHHAMAGQPASYNFLYLHHAMAGRPASYICINSQNLDCRNVLIRQCQGEITSEWGEAIAAATSTRTRARHEETGEGMEECVSERECV